jgi:tRNA nucleotidyltransferase (CCA-adding enzyme)
MELKTDLPLSIFEIYQTFSKGGYELYLVGGVVRHLLQHKNFDQYKHIKDWDLTTNAEPEQILSLFPNAFYNNQFGTVGIPVNNKSETFVVEVTTFRSESEYKDRRHPEKVTWGKTIEEDLQRRDFTINAIAIKLSTDNSQLSTQIIDPHDGQVDLNNHLIRAVGNPEERFKEDALRLMRAIRFATELGFTIETNTLKAIIHDAPLLDEISKERIHDELLKILDSKYPYEGVMLLKNTNLLAVILPELLEGVGVEQERPGRHHKDDVFTHNVLSLKYCPATNPVIRFATLIHDVGKPRVRGEDENGYVIFYNHEVVGSRMAYEICNRMRFSKKDRTKIVTLIRWHMFTVDENITDSAVRRFIRRIGTDNVKDMMDLRVGDRLGGGTQTAESWRLKLFKKRVEDQLAPAPFSINDLAVDGNDVMKILNIKPSRKIGEILQKLFIEVDENLEKNNKEFLTQRVKELA